MTGIPSDETRHSLHEQLAAAESGGSGGERISRFADLAGGRYACAMAALISLYLLVVVYIYPQEILWLDITTTVVFVAGIVGTCMGYGRRRRASSLGWSKRYSAGFALSVGFFAVGVALLDSAEARPAWFWIPYAALTGLPLLATALTRNSR